MHGNHLMVILLFSSGQMLIMFYFAQAILVLFIAFLESLPISLERLLVFAQF